MTLKIAIVSSSELGETWCARDHIIHNGVKLRDWERLQEITRLRCKYLGRIARLNAEEKELKEKPKP